MRGLLLLLALAAVLAGCTGTTENVPPLLLAVGRIDTSTTPAQPQMVLVEDNFPNQPRLTVVANSSRPLPYEAVADDVTDRASLSRSSGGSTLEVLTRDLSGGTSPASALVTFDLAGIVPSNPTAFQQLSSLQLTGGTNPVFTATNGGPGPWCFSAVSVSSTGRYVYLIDDPNACLVSPIPQPQVRLFQLDTSTRAVVQILTGSSLQPTAPFDDQSQTSEGLYFLVSATTYAQLYRVPVPFDPKTTTPNQVATMPGTSQLALKRDGADLVSVTNDSPYGPPTVAAPSSLQSLALPASGTAATVRTVDSARALAVDSSGSTATLVVAGYHQVAVHTSPSDASPAETASGYGLTGVVAAIDPLNGFGYVVNSGYIVVLDLLNAGSSSTAWYATSTSYLPASQLTLPKDAGGRYVSALAWTRAAP